MRPKLLRADLNWSVNEVVEALRRSEAEGGSELVGLLLGVERKGRQRQQALDWLDRFREAWKETVEPTPPWGSFQPLPLIVIAERGGRFAEEEREPFLRWGITSFVADSEEFKFEWQLEQLLSEADALHCFENDDFSSSDADPSSPIAEVFSKSPSDGRGGSGARTYEEVLTALADLNRDGRERVD